jgi:hypothetical protein
VAPEQADGQNAWCCIELSNRNASPSGGHTPGSGGIREFVDGVARKNPDRAGAVRDFPASTPARRLQ